MGRIHELVLVTRAALHCSITRAALHCSTAATYICAVAYAYCVAAIDKYRECCYGAARYPAHYCVHSFGVMSSAGLRASGNQHQCLLVVNGAVARDAGQCVRAQAVAARMTLCMHCSATLRSCGRCLVLW